MSLRHFLLTLPLYSTQLTWAFEFSFGTPLLLHRGFSTFLTTLVWLAGPLSGLIIQPLFGKLSDNYRSSYGKRRPFIVFSWFCTTVALLMLLVTDKRITLVTSFIAFYVLDASLNISMAAVRALMVDKSTEDEQVFLNGWAGRMIGAGQLCGYALTSVWKGVHGVLFITILFNTVCTAITVFYISEESTYKDERTADVERLIRAQENSSDNVQSSLKESVTGIYINVKTAIQDEELMYIYKVQFFAWIGWFPILFYNSAWLSRLYMIECVNDCDFSEVTSNASSAMIYFSLLSFAASVVIPQLFSLKFVDFNKGFWIRAIWSISHFVFTGIALSVCMLTWANAIDFTVGRILISGLGLCWSVTLWVPPTLLSEYIVVSRPETAGELIGVTNIFTVLPQFVSLFICGVFFAANLDFSWVFLLSAVSSLVAALLAVQI